MHNYENQEFQRCRLSHCELIKQGYTKLQHGHALKKKIVLPSGIGRRNKITTDKTTMNRSIQNIILFSYKSECISSHTDLYKYEPLQHNTSICCKA